MIDFRVRLRTSEALEAWVPKPIPQFERYIDFYKMKPRLTYQTPEETIGEMKAAGIAKAVLCSGSKKGNRFVSKMCEKYGNFFIGIAGARLENGIMNAYRELKKMLKAHFLGFNFGGLLQNPPMAIDDKKLYPLYSLCVDYGVCAIIHSSLHYYSGARLYLNHPFRIDNVAVDFPDLRIVMSHAGNGFGDLPLVLAQRHPNVFLEVSALRPKHLSQSYVTAMNKYLSQKFIFGSDYPLLPFTIVDEWKQCVNQENHRRFFQNNAMVALHGRKK
ncbi:MAG: amidohydrolase family protein [Candidatus Bathyarchaeota archaeon]|nr:MAG: amidohydrolase family protein [Candidatus Bathyarchaeota archaeon]